MWRGSLCGLSFHRVQSCSLETMLVSTGVSPEGLDNVEKQIFFGRSIKWNNYFNRFWWGVKILELSIISGFGSQRQKQGVQGHAWPQDQIEAHRLAQSRETCKGIDRPTAPGRQETETILHLTQNQSQFKDYIALINNCSGTYSYCLVYAYAPRVNVHRGPKTISAVNPQEPVAWNSLIRLSTLSREPRISPFLSPHPWDYKCWHYA